MKISKVVQKTVTNLLEYLQSERWSFTDVSGPGAFAYEIRFASNDIPIELKLIVQPERQTFVIESAFDFRVAESDVGRLALALVVINDNVLYGKFDLNIIKGTITYFFASYFGDAPMSYDQFATIISYVNTVVDRYNDKILLVNLNRLSINDLYNFVYKTE